jgi:hypothetical protein
VADFINTQTVVYKFVKYKYSSCRRQYVPSRLAQWHHASFIFIKYMVQACFLLAVIVNIFCDVPQSVSLQSILDVKGNMCCRSQIIIFSYKYKYNSNKLLVSIIGVVFLILRCILLNSLSEVESSN